MLSFFVHRIDKIEKEQTFEKCLQIESSCDIIKRTNVLIIKRKTGRRYYEDTKRYEYV